MGSPLDVTNTVRIQMSVRKENQWMWLKERMKKNCCEPDGHDDMYAEYDESDEHIMW